MKPYDHKKIEQKWQKEWKALHAHKTGESRTKKKCYVLDMFPYPSGEGLHVGHPKGYIASDIYARYKRMNGYNVLHPMGWDAFGLPAENFAITHKVHPRKAVEKNVKRFKEQLSVIGFNYDWEREINTTDPAFYKWTQWIFLKMYEKGLAYESYEPINWCPSCQTGLANEDLEDGRCERCGSEIERKPMRQWVLKITKYADKLLKGLDKLDWPESIKESQRNWIGRNEGVKYKLNVKGLDLAVETYSTHYEAFCADTFAVIASDHKLLPELLEGLSDRESILRRAQEITSLRNQAGFKTEDIMEGIFTGVYLEDPITQKDLPLWVSSYALADYGTGIVKCSAHDQRDFAFAKKYNIGLHTVLLPNDPQLREAVEKQEICFSDFGNATLLEPEIFKGRNPHEVRKDIANYIEKNKWGERSTQYKLRDWVFSRQRYWGEPIPIIHCAQCGVVPVPEKDLPVKLPDVKSYAPTGTGESPLADIKKWVNVKCPKCKGAAKRETNTMPQWAGSSWYYLRYIDPKNKRALVDKKKEKYWSPVDLYVGGAEHATRHLIYARFWHKFLHDINAVNHPEPFTRLEHVGLIMAEDGRKMSKRYGNVVNPDDVVKTYGADTLRLYEMFLGPFDQAASWSTQSIIGPRRFVERVWALAQRVDPKASVRPEAETLLHRTIQKVGEDIESFGFNTAISALMILTNELEKDAQVNKTHIDVLVRLLAPFAPHVAEELWVQLGNKGSVHTAAWPTYDKKKLVAKEVTLAVQVNGKVRGVLTVPAKMAENEVVAAAQKLPSITPWLAEGQVKRVIHVPGKIVNIVVVPNA